VFAALTLRALFGQQSSERTVLFMEVECVRESFLQEKIPLHCEKS